ncbi:hypothetical protein Pan241w_11470 [Gimesia alba]|uniref:Uncharacterized protein n=1 Tax=Gimesia alba TaxID=2527973 RepID=A0A517RB39_9PLAN|nr:hypothetical protein [Gimesia alba]QDT41088.1 hypothetical protein Pan241w_11470 [Gimesia alba]
MSTRTQLNDNSEMKILSFSDEVQNAVSLAVLNYLKKGDWISPGYTERIQIPASHIRAVYESIDMNRVYEIVGEKVEQKIADAIFNKMATEIANDTKQIMCHTELREDCRSVIREKIRESMAALGEPD